MLLALFSQDFFAVFELASWVERSDFRIQGGGWKVCNPLVNEHREDECGFCPECVSLKLVHKCIRVLKRTL